MSEDSRTPEAERSGISRRALLRLMGAGAASAALLPTAGASAALADDDDTAAVQGRGDLRPRRPNFLVILVDELRSSPVYESPQLKAWRVRNLPNMNSLQRNGFTLGNHHIMSAACAPSRASIFTGQYPSLHGVTQTTGAAKSAIEEDVFWLDPTTVPTMGHYFRAAGYETFYKGKWHVSDADLYQPGSHDTLPSYTASGRRDLALERIYLEADMLDRFGFAGWVGPEPHGASPLNSGSSAPGGQGRDAVYAQQGVEQLRRLQQSNTPWLLVTSFVNPHDITIWGDLTLASRNYYLMQSLTGSNVPFNLFDDRYRVSSEEDLAGKPAAQASYRDAYGQAFQPTRNGQEYHRFYYQMQANVDKQIGHVLRALRSGGPQFYRDTVVVFLSDHGELLGAHGGLFQKWHQAYDEVLRVPAVFHNPTLFPRSQTTSALTSHADLLPTMLGLAGVSQSSLRRQLALSHTQVRQLPGRDLSPLLLGRQPGSAFRQPQYFMTDDEPTRGSQQVAFNGEMYASVVAPAHLETVVAQLPTGAKGALEQWKYTRYFDNPDFWSEPGVQDVQTMIDGNMNDPGTKTASTTVKTSPVPDQVEVYNVTRDPTEMQDLSEDPAAAGTVRQLKALLAAQRKAKRLEPRLDPRFNGIPGGIGV
jgi:choline-sulfatase